MSRYIMAIDANKCINCKACVLACQQRNGTPYGHSRNWVRETPDKLSLLGTAYQPGACMHCDHPLCVEACPTHATYKADDGSVGIDPERCIGCGGCIEACPYGARYKHPVTGRADKCDYCRRATPGQVPACVQVCPVRCRVFGDADNPDDPVARALAGNRHVYVVPPDFDAKPTLAYLNGTTPTDWPRRKDVPPALAAIGPLSSVVKAFGGLAQVPPACEVALRRKDGQDYLVVLNYLKEPQEIVLQEPMVDLDTRCDVEGPVVLGSYETKVYRVKF